MDTDIEFGRLVTHGAIAGLAGAAHEVIDANDSLTPAERAARHALALALQGVSHAVTEAVAKAIDGSRRS